MTNGRYGMGTVEINGREYHLKEQAYRACGQKDFELLYAYQALAEDVESGEMVLIRWDMLPEAVAAEGTPDAWLAEDACNWDEAYIVA